MFLSFKTPSCILVFILSFSRSSFQFNPITQIVQDVSSISPQKCLQNIQRRTRKFDKKYREGNGRNEAPCLNILEKKFIIQYKNRVKSRSVCICNKSIIKSSPYTRRSLVNSLYTNMGHSAMIIFVATGINKYDNTNINLWFLKAF